MCVSFATVSESRQRDVFPLPPFADFLDCEGGGGSDCAKRRASKRCHVGRWCEELSATLNEMCGISHAMHANQKATLSQRLVMRHLRDAVAACGEPPSGLTGREALRALLAKQGYSGGTTAELPSGLLEPVPLATLMGAEGQTAVQQFISSSVLPKNAARAKMAECEVKQAYMDPQLREDPRTYGRLLSRLHRCGMVEWRRSGVARVGLFAVQKKEGKQRLIVDARIANCIFTESRPVHLCSGSTLGGIQMPEGSCLHLGQVVIENAFYNMLMPEELIEYFGLPRIKSRHLDSCLIDSAETPGDCYVHPHFRVVPMGFSHALFVVPTCTRIDDRPHRVLTTFAAAPRSCTCAGQHRPRGSARTVRRQLLLGGWPGGRCLQGS